MSEHIQDDVIKVVNQFQSELLIGSLITIDENKSRIRLLPLRK